MRLNEIQESMQSAAPERRQHARTRDLFGFRLSPFILIALLYVLNLLVFYQQGVIRGTTLLYTAGEAFGFAMIFYAVFRSGLNRRFNEPNLLLPQLFIALVTLLTVTYFERSTQVTLAPFLLIAISACIFHLAMPTLVAISLSCLCAYLGMLLMRDYNEHFPPVLRDDLINWSAFALTLPVALMFCKQVQRMRKVLLATQYELAHYEEKATRDELTGLFNRRCLLAELEQARLRADAESIPFAICLVDIDHFKQINDTYGHLAGDNVLCDFAHAARECIRDNDILGRYGGDEFLQILPRTDLRGAMMHAERLRVYAHFLDFTRHVAQKHISLSIGVAEYRFGETITDLIARADSALYLAKQLGRNRVEWVEA